MHLVSFWHALQQLTKAFTPGSFLCMKEVHLTQKKTDFQKCGTKLKEVS